MPFRRWELMLAKIVPTFVVSLGALALAFWVPWWFAVPIRGIVPLFFALSALFLVSALGLGLLLGTLAANLQQALLLSFFTLFPVLVVSGPTGPGAGDGGARRRPRGARTLALRPAAPVRVDVPDSLTPSGSHSEPVNESRGRGASRLRRDAPSAGGQGAPGAPHELRAPR